MTLEDVIEYEKRDSFDAGLEQGREEGHNIGLIEGFISASREFGKSDNEIIQSLMEKFSLTREAAVDKLTN